MVLPLVPVTPMHTPIWLIGSSKKQADSSPKTARVSEATITGMSSPSGTRHCVVDEQREGAVFNG